jgi:hypothetical protein
MWKVLIGAVIGAIRSISSAPPLNQTAPSGAAAIECASALTPAKIWVISPLGVTRPIEGGSLMPGSERLSRLVNQRLPSVPRTSSAGPKKGCP